jgi:hypothetical protein
MWSQDREKRASMDKLCKAFGIEGKGDFDGSMVAATWPVDPQKVVDYCCADVERTRALYYRMTFDQRGKADAGSGELKPQELRQQPEAAITPPVQITREPQGAVIPDAAMITEFLALQACSPAAKKEMRATLERWETYRCKMVAARGMAAAE